MPHLFQYPSLGNALFAAMSGILWLCAMTAQAQSDEALTQSERYQVIEMPAERIPALMGQDIDRVGIEVVKRGMMQPIPNQIDEYNEDGQVYFEEAPGKIDGKGGIVDPNDRLLFMLADTGPRRTERMVASGKIISEIELQTQSGEKRYAYLVRDPKLRSEVQHVRYSSDLGQLETDHYSITASPDNALNWDDFQYYNYTGEKGSPLDTMKLRMRTGVITPITKATMNNHNFIAKPIGERVGAVRTTAQFKVTIKFFKVPMMKAYVQAHYYPKSFTYEAKMKVPMIRRALLNNPQLYVSLDGNDLQGALIKTALTPNVTGLVDGLLSNMELKMMEQGVNQEQNWVWVSTQHNFDWVSFIEFDDDRKLPVDFFIIDDPEMEDQPEKYVGQGPNLGYHIKDIPNLGWLKFRIRVYLSDGFNVEQLATAETALRKMPLISVTDSPTYARR